MANTITPAGKKLKLHHRRRRSPPLLPGLPDHIAETCLSQVRPEILYSVCKLWRNLIYSPSFSPFLSIYVLFVSNQATDLSDSLVFSSFDPVSKKWRSVPSPPDDPPVRLIVRHPFFISRNLPVQSVSVSGKLVLLAATTDNFAPALSSPLVFNPLTRNWSSAPPLSAARRWCVAGACGNSVYVGSGVGYQYNTEVARSVEKLEFVESKCDNFEKLEFVESNCENFDKNWEWKKLGLLKNVKFSREAIEAVSYRGKLCMVNVKGDYRKEGLVYDVENDTWQDSAPPLSAARRWCVAGACGNSVYVGSGVGYQYNTEVARSVEKLEFVESKCDNFEKLEFVDSNCDNFEKNWEWKKLGLLKNGKFSREAIEAVGYRGKLCMVNVKGDYRKEGLVYDVENDTWQDMPEGMLAGWRGPAASMKEESLYVVDESKGVLKKYNSDDDRWMEVIECEKLQGAEHMAAEGGRVCVVCSSGVDIVVVDVVAYPPQLFVVETPEGLQATSIHVLPRMSCLNNSALLQGLESRGIEGDGDS